MKKPKMTPDRVFVSFAKLGYTTVGEERDEVEAQSDTEAVEYVRVVACRQCGKACEEACRHYATPVCFACLAPPVPLPTSHLYETLATQLAAAHGALEAIAALQAEAPEWRPVLHRDSADGYYGKWHEAAEQLHGAAEMARVALRGGK